MYLWSQWSDTVTTCVGSFGVSLETHNVVVSLLGAARTSTCCRSLYAFADVLKKSKRKFAFQCSGYHTRLSSLVFPRADHWELREFLSHICNNIISTISPFKTLTCFPVSQTLQANLLNCQSLIVLVNSKTTSVWQRSFS